MSQSWQASLQNPPAATTKSRRVPRFRGYPATLRGTPAIASRYRLILKSAGWEPAGGQLAKISEGTCNYIRCWHLPCCVLIFLRTYVNVPYCALILFSPCCAVIFFALNLLCPHFIFAYPAVLLFSLTLLFSIIFTYPAAPFFFFALPLCPDFIFAHPAVRLFSLTLLCPYFTPCRGSRWAGVVVRC